MSDTLMEASAPFGAAPDSLFREVLQRFRETNPTFLIDDDVVRRYHLAMQTRGFVILSGLSGTGKTWLAQAYATPIGAQVQLAAVDPSWSSNEDLLGYLSPLDGFYHHTPFSEFVQEAAREWTRPRPAGRTAREYHVILDEMNLARVEHYFSRFLSAMEVRSREGDRPARPRAGPRRGALAQPEVRRHREHRRDHPRVRRQGVRPRAADRAAAAAELRRRVPGGRALRRAAAERLGRAAAHRAVRVPRAAGDPPVRGRRDGDRHASGRTPWTSSSCRRSCPRSAAPRRSGRRPGGVPGGAG